MVRTSAPSPSFSRSSAVAPPQQVGSGQVSYEVGTEFVVMLRSPFGGRWKRPDSELFDQMTKSLQGGGSEAVADARAFDFAGDHASFLEHAQVLGTGGLRARRLFPDAATH